jgi:nitrite reductase/ring-hydroxylating ferredoxin subunit
MDRRSLLTAAVAALGGSIAAGLAGLGGVFAHATSRWPVRRAKEWAALCTLGDLKEGEPLARSFSFDRLEGWYLETVTRQVYVTRGARGAPVVFSRRCTHLGCQVTWKPQSATFKCPCHGGVFDGSGRVVDGPPPRGLDVLSCRVAGDIVEVEKA